MRSNKLPCTSSQDTLFNPSYSVKAVLNGEAVFASITAYLKPSVKKELEQQLEESYREQIFYIDLAKKINLGDWNGLFAACDMKLFPLHALRCLKEGLISDMTFSTSQLFYNVWTDEDNIKEKEMPMRFVSVFSNQKKRIGLADAMIDATMKVIPAPYKLMLKILMENDLNSSELEIIKTINEKMISVEDEKIWTEEQKKRFLNKLLKLPTSEQSFLLVRDSLIEDVKRNHFSVMDVINFALGFNALCRLSFDKQPMRMIPSRGMMQAYLEAISPDTTPKPVYRFGLSTIKGMHDTLKTNGRDLFQTYALLPQCTPKEADGYPAVKRYAESEMHDFYHQMRISHIPLLEREAFNLIADKLLSFAGSKDTRNKFASRFAVRIIDMEHSIYDINKNKLQNAFRGVDKTLLEPNEKFWHSLNASFNTAIEMLSASPKDKDVEDTIDALIEWLLEDEFGLNQDYQVIMDSINQYEKKITTPIIIFLNDLPKILKERLQKKVLSELYEKGLYQLLVSYSHLNNKTMRDRLCDVFILGILDQYADESLMQSIEVCYRFFKLNNQSKPYQATLFIMHLAIVKNMKDKFDTHFSSGFLKEIHEEFNDAFCWVMNSIKASSQQYDYLMDMAIKKGEEGKFLFDMLYRKTEINRIFESDNTTLLHRALAAENMELMMQLTNDGAKIVDLLSYLKVIPEEFFKIYPSMCPMERSFVHGRPELSALLYFAYKNGAGWMQRYPEEVARFRRLSCNYNQKLPDLHQDMEWVLDLCKNIPAWIISEKANKHIQEVREYHEYSQAFFNKVKKEGHGTPTPEFADKFVRFREWQKKGGVISEIEIPTFKLGS